MTRHHEELAEYNETMREVQELRAEIERLKAALDCIIDMCPVTAEVTLAHQMADCAMAALDAKP